MRRLVRLGALGTVAVLIACGGGGQPASTSAASPGGAVTVRYRSFQVEPASVTVAKGKSVTWTNEDGTTHTVTSGTPGSKSGKFDHRVSGNASVDVRFDEAGTFDYFCEFHTTMRGKVVVN